MLRGESSRGVATMDVVFFGFGDDEMDPAGGLLSEYGVVGATVYLSASIFF